MANTNVIKNEIQPFVREWLKQKYGVAFGRSKLPLHECEGWHDFDAVSTDGRLLPRSKLLLLGQVAASIPQGRGLQPLSSYISCHSRKRSRSFWF